MNHIMEQRELRKLLKKIKIGKDNRIKLISGD